MRPFGFALAALVASVLLAGLSGCGGQGVEKGPEGEEEGEAFAGSWRIYSESIFYDAGGNNTIRPVSTRLELRKDGTWQFGSSHGTWAVAATQAEDWTRWGIQPYGTTRKLLLEGWNRSRADGPIEESWVGVDFLWAIYRVTEPQPAAIWMKFGRP